MNQPIISSADGDKKLRTTLSASNVLLKSIAILVLLFSAVTAKSATYYTRGAGGNWGTAATWSTAGCNGAASLTIPGIGDDVIICNSNGSSTVTVTVNGNYSCNNLTIGTSAASATVQTSSAAYVLTIGGTLTFNSGNGAGTYTLSASTGTCTVAGPISWNTVNGINKFAISSGILNFTQDVAIANANQQITFSSTGKVYFNGNFTDAQNKLTAYSGCKVYFAGSYAANTTNAVWNTGAYAYFTGIGKTITATSNITFAYVVIDAGASISNVYDAGTLAIVRDFTLNASASYTVNKALTVTYSVVLGASSSLILNDNITIGRSWTNNGGTLTGNDKIVNFTGYGYTIGGTSATDFPNLVVGLAGTTTRTGYTQNANVTCTNFILETNSYANTSAYTLGVSNPTLAVAEDLTVKQLTSVKANSVYVNGGALTVSGNLIFSGTVNTAAQVTQVVVTSGSFNLVGTITWMAQTGTALVATEVISVTTGTLTFAKSVSLPKGSGTIKVTSTGIINLNGVVAPSLDLNAAGTGTTNAIFTVALGGSVNFKTGFTSAYSQTFTAGSYQNFTGTGTITSTGGVVLRFGHFMVSSSATITLANNIQLQNDWTNNGSVVTGTNSVTFNGAAATIQNITKPGGETFYTLVLSTTSGQTKMNNDVTITYSFAMSGRSIDMNGYTLLLGNGSGAILTRSAGTLYNGIFKRYWPAGAITSSGGNIYGLFPIGPSATAYRPVAMRTTANTTGAGYVWCIHNNSSSVTETTYSESGIAIQRVSDQSSTVYTSGVTGGTYSVDVSYTNFNSAGIVGDLRLQVKNGGTYSAVGTHATTTGTATSPTIKRTALTLAQLANTFVAGTKNEGNTPIVAFYYTRGEIGNWSNTASWSTIAGGAGASCSCTPPTASYVMVCAGQTISVDAATTIEFIKVETGGTIDGTSNLTVNREIKLMGTGRIAPTAGVWVVSEFEFLGTTTSTSGASLSISNDLTIPANNSLIMGAALTVSGDLTVNGTLDIGSTTAILNGTAGKTIDGTGTINGTGILSITTADKSILTGSTLTIAPAISIANSTALTNNGTVTLTGNLTGGNNSSTWINAAGSVLNTAGTVLSTGTLTASASPNTVNYNGSGAQTIKNTTYDNLKCTNAGTKSIAANFVVNEAVTIQDAAILDESTYTITGAADLIMSGTSELKMQRTGNATYPEITGTYTLTGGTVTINQTTTNTATLQAANYYNLKLNGSRPYDMTDVSTINRNLDVETSATLTNSANLTVAGTLSYTGSGTTTLTGDVQAGGIILTNGILNDGGNTITITGTAGWTKSGGTFVSTGDVVFQGSVAQSIDGASSTTFNNLTINNSSSTGVTLNQPISISGYLELTDGYLYTSYTNILTINDGATASQGLSGSFVDGPMTKIGNDAFIFPIGDYNSLGRAAITAPASAATHFTAEYRRASYGNDHALTAPLKKVSTIEHWLLERTGTSDAVGLTLYWGNAGASGISDCNDLRIAHWNGSSWVKEAATVSGSCSGAGSISTVAGLTSFSPFSFGSEKEQMANNPLPIELLSFNAVVNDKNVDLTWATATEINNDFFTVEKSADGVLFTEVLKTPGAGNSNTTLNYIGVDASPLNGYSYYRLKQTDFNGQYTYSNIVAVNFHRNTADVATIYPNPLTNGNLKIKLDLAIENGSIEVVVYDLQGMKVFAEWIDISELQANGYYELNRHFDNGSYIVNLKGNGLDIKKRLVVLN